MLVSKTSLVIIALGFVIFLGVIIGSRKLSDKPTKPSNPTLNMNNTNVIRYLPLGDSYTIGENVKEADRWPNQLAAQYKPNGKQLQIVANPAVTGYTSKDLIERELPLVKQLEPDFVTVLIGVNDYIQGVEINTFEQNLRYIVAELQQKLANPRAILLVTIPDYAKTPAGAKFGDAAVATAKIQQFNSIIISVATAAKLPSADIFNLSQQLSSDPAHISDDSLHPSAKQYAAWTVAIRQSLQTANLFP